MATNPKIVISAQDKTKAAFDSVNARMEKTAKSAAVVGAAAVAGLTVLTTKSMESIDAQAKLSDRLGISTEALAAFNLQGKLAGASGDDVNGALQKMSKNLGDAAQGFGQARTLLRAMNVDMDALAQMNTEDQYKAIADAIRGLDSPAKQVSATLAIFGRSGANMLNMIKGGSDAFEAAKKQATDYGLAISRIDAAKVEAANDAMTRAQKVVEGYGNKLAVALAPLIEASANEFVNLAKQAGLTSDAIVADVRVMVVAIGKMADLLDMIEMGWKNIKQVSAQGAADVLDGVKKATNDVLNPEDVWNNTLASIPIFGELLQGTIGAQKDTIIPALQKVSADTAAAINDGMEASLPSETFAAKFDEIVKKSQKAAEAVAAVNRTKAAADAAGPVSMSDKQREAAAAQFDQMGLDLQAQEDQLTASYERRLNIIQNAMDAGYVIEGRGLALMKQQQDHYENSVLSLKARSAMSQFGTVASMLDKTTAALATKSRTMFEINKAAATANAIIQGITTVMNSYAHGSQYGGYYGGAIEAALAAIGVAGQIAAIQSASYGGGGSVSASGGGGGGSVPSGTASTPSVPTTSQDKQAREHAYYITLPPDDQAPISNSQWRKIKDMQKQDEKDGIISRLVING